MERPSSRQDLPSLTPSRNASMNWDRVGYLMFIEVIRRGGRWPSAAFAAPVRAPSLYPRRSRLFGSLWVGTPDPKLLTLILEPYSEREVEGLEDRLGLEQRPHSPSVVWAC